MPRATTVPGGQRRCYHQTRGQQRRTVGKTPPLGDSLGSLDLNDQRNRYGNPAQALAQRQFLCGPAHVAGLTAQCLDHRRQLVDVRE